MDVALLKFHFKLIQIYLPQSYYQMTQVTYCCDINQELYPAKKTMVMKKNMGKADRVIRIFIAAIIAILYLTQIMSGVLTIILLTVGFIFLVTSVTGFCPIYKLLGINTCKRKDSSTSSH
ncbi:YgaP family membrane protein [Parafilimonas sp.]|uniref:YgaP family membrane protein n=1 Tax=Parafilimonas sp. TaxID=1969739 RepID=UPI003F7FBC6F